MLAILSTPIDHYSFIKAINSFNTCSGHLPVTCLQYNLRRDRGLHTILAHPLSNKSPPLHRRIMITGIRLPYARCHATSDRA